MKYLWIFFIVGCASNSKPHMNIELWAGDSEESGITRSQESDSIPCFSPKFDQFVCMRYEDLMKIYESFSMCKEWGNEQR